MRRPATPTAGRAFGFLGGSFDPVHRGHLALARAALRERRLERVFLVPTGRSPFKGNAQSSPRDRLALLKAAVRGQRGLGVGLWEIHRPGPSFTIDTIERLKRRYPHRRWEVIVGEDAWKGIRRWRRWKDLVSEVTFVVGRRRPRNGKIGKAAGSPVVLRTPLPEVSSTEIRRSLDEGRPVSRWVGRTVAREINRRGIYPPAWSQCERPVHARSVARWARWLARRYGADPTLAAQAGAWHDAAKHWSPARMSRVARRLGLAVPGGTAVSKGGVVDLLHGPAAAYAAEQRGVNLAPSVRRAMARHTVGHPRMGLLDKILFVADYSASDRATPGAARVRRLARINLDAAVLETVRRKIIHVLDRGGVLLPPSIGLWNALAGKKRE